MNQLRIAVALLMLMLLLTTWYIPSAMAGNYYISKTGKDSNDGSLAHPWATINYAMEHTKAGDTIYMRGGTYNDGEVWVRTDYGLGGAAGKYWTLQAYNGEEVTLNNSARPFIVDAPYVRIAGLKFISKSVSVCTWHGMHEGVEILNCTFTGVFDYGAIDFAGKNGLIKGNKIMIDYTTQGTQGHGIYLMRGSGTIVRNNYISGPTGYCIHVYDEHKSEDPAGYIPVISDVIIDSNYVTNSKERLGIIVAADYTAQVKNILIKNNAIVDNDGGGISLSVVNGKVEDIKIYNNTIYGTGEGSYKDGISIDGKIKNVEIKNNIIVINNKADAHIRNYGNSQNVIADCNLYWPSPKKLVNVADSHALVADPKFVDPANHDFHLQSTSPAIDKGVDVGIPYLGTAPDLGEYEYANFPLAVELVFFKAQARGDVVHLTWQTISEVDNFGFEIERRVKGQEFKKIAFVKGAGSTKSLNSYEYSDKNLKEGSYYYRLRQINLNGTFKVYSEVAVTVEKPVRFNLEQNYPNPFNGETAIAFNLAADTFVDLSIFNSMGERVATLIRDELTSGWKTVKWRGVDDYGRNVGSGVYLYRLAAGDYSAVRKMILLQ